MLVIKQLMTSIIGKKYCESLRVPSTVSLVTNYYFVFNWRQKLIQGWNYLRVS